MRNHEEKLLKNFSIGLPKTVTYDIGKQMETGICKDSIEEAYLTKAGFVGDGVADVKHHGGPDRAVCIYPYEHYAQWEEEFGSTLAASTFGENITVTNMLEADVNIGDIYQLGDAIIQVTQGRVPCSTINKRAGLPFLMKRMVETGFTGYLCRVLQEGLVRKDSSVTLLEKHPKGISVLFTNEVYFHRPKDLEAMQTIFELEELAEKWKEYMANRIAKLTTS